MNESKSYFDKRWKLCILGYVVGYMTSIGSFDAPSLIYYIPIKMWAFYFAWFMGFGAYKGAQDVKKGKSYISIIPGFVLKYAIPGLIVCLLLQFLIGKILYMVGIDGTPFLDIR